MSRAARTMMAVVLASALPASMVARAQPSDAASANVVDAYMESRGLKSLLAAHLLQQLRNAEGAERSKLAERLSKLQVELFDAATTPERQEQWERRTRELLSLVPDSESLELRLSLAKARFSRAEPNAELALLRVLSPDAAKKAEAEFRELAPVFADLALKANRTIDNLRRREDGAPDEELAPLRALIEQAGQTAAASAYFAGWSSLYLAQMTGSKQDAESALVQLGSLLNAMPGRMPTVDRVPEGRLAVDHIARAALACAVAEALRGKDDTALRWIDAVEQTPGLPQDIREMIWPRRLLVLATSKRWGDLSFWIDKRRELDRGTTRPAKPLSAADARLLCVYTMEALSDPATTAQARPALETLASVGLADLIAAGELRHVADLVSRYGSAQLPKDGFLPHYVRGLQAYEDARKLHTAAGNADQPTAVPTIANRYRDAATALSAAAKSPDLANFPAERSNAVLTAGLALFYAGDLEAASSALEAAFADGAQGKQAEDALWMAVLALDRGVRDGQTGLRDRFRKLATLFLKTYPRTDRAVNLLLNAEAGGAVTEDRAIEILLAIERTSPVYDRAHRQAANLLYAAFARAPQGSARDFAALRFLGVADEALRIERRIVIESRGTDAAPAERDVMVRLAQILAASLETQSPDVERAGRALDLYDAMSKDASVGSRALAAEIAFRRVQLALLRDDQTQLATAIERLRALGGPQVQRVDRLMYNRAVSTAAAPGATAAQLRDVVTYGRRLLDGSDTATPDARLMGVMNAVADAATKLWETSTDAEMRDLALSIDRRLAALPAPPVESLRRSAALLEASGDSAAALETWRRVLAGADASGALWIEARYQTIRLLARLEPARAREALDQLKVLRPDFGPEPWSSRLKELDAQLPASASEPPKDQPK